MLFLKGKKALILGVANDKSIATGIARAIFQQGGEIALTYQNEKLQSRVEKLSSETGNGPIFQCDITNENELSSVAEQIKNKWGGLDVVIHAIAFAPRDQLEGNYVNVTTKEGFLMAQEVSAWSFTALAQVVEPILNAGSSLLTLTYLGSIRAVPNYNIMGIAKASLESSVRYMAQSLGPKGVRVNAISAGPIRTLAASGIKNFRDLQDKAASITPLGRPVTIEEVGNTAAFLSSDLASGITGEVVYVDGGYNIVAGGA